MRRDRLLRGLCFPGVALLFCFAGKTTAADCEFDADEVVGTSLVCFDRVFAFDEPATTSANASIGDLNGDGHLDVALIKGRHWPVTNQYLFGDGTGKFSAAVDLGNNADRSYTGALADVDGDHDLDIVVSNDKPDRNLIYINDGHGQFAVGSTFGQSQWKTRNISVSDVNGDNLPDIVVANRDSREVSSPNYICLNLGEGRFQNNCLQFSDESATTITPADVNGDNLLDLVVPHRDGGQSHIYLGQPLVSIRFEARPFGPAEASIRATAVADFDLDGRMDIVAIHTGNSEGGDGVVDRGRNFRGTTIYYGLGDTKFSEGKLLDDVSRMPYALSVADINLDGAMDVIVGHVDATSTVYLARPSERKFHGIDLGDNDGSTYGFAIGDLNEDGLPDIVVAKSGARNRYFFGRRVTND